MNIIIGHTNMDLDCIGSLVLAGYLYPDYTIVRSRLVHPVAQNILNLYKKKLNMENPKILKGQHIDKVVVVDTRTSNRIKEYFDITDYSIDNVEEVVIYDHHEADTCDIKNAILRTEKLGANVSILVKRLIDEEISITSEDATIALLGVYTDTGGFLFDSTTTDDLQAAAWLKQQGAKLSLVRKLLKPMKEDSQIGLFHTVMNKLEVKKILGHYILMSYLEIPKQEPGIGAVVEKIMDVEDPDALFLVVSIDKGKQTLIIGRSQKDEINISELLKPYGGGGHKSAGSARLKEYCEFSFLDKFVWYLRSSLLPSTSAGSLMTKEVFTINENATLIDASKYLEDIGHTGCPVLNKSDELVGVITLRNISKGRSADQMSSPVKSYMAKKIATFSLDTSIREIEKTFFSKNIGHIPVVKSKKLVGILTRQDFLDYINEVRK